MRAISRRLLPVLSGLLFAAASLSARAGNPTVMLIPAREKAVAFGFDVARIKPVTLVSYDMGAGAGAPLMHIWDARAGQWVKTDLDAYAGGKALKPAPDRVIIVGNNTATVADLAAASSWCGDVTKIPTLKMDDVINTLNAKLHFSDRDWAWLSKRQGIEIEDINVEKRRQRARFGNPDVAREKNTNVNSLVHWFKTKETLAIERQKKEDALKQTVKPIRGNEPNSKTRDLSPPPAESQTPVESPTPVEPPKAEPPKTEAPVLQAPPPAPAAEPPAPPEAAQLPKMTLPEDK